MIIPASFTYLQESREGFQTRSDRIEFRFCSIGSIIELTAKVDVRFCSITNSIERLVFD